MTGKSALPRPAAPRARAAAPKRPASAPAAPKRTQGRPQKQDPGISRDVLIAATRELLKTVPPAKVTRAAISRAAGVDPALIRYYFGDKAALLAATTEAAARELRERQRAAVAEGGTVEERLRGRVRALVEALYETPYLHGLLLEQIVYGPGDARQEIREELITGALREWEALLRQGAKEGRFRAVDARHLLLAVVGMCSFPMSERPLFAELFGGRAMTQSMAADYAEFASNLLLTGLAPAGSAKG